MTSYDEIAPILQIILNTVAKECGTTQEHLSLEIEQVLTRALMEAYQKGFDAAHDRPTAQRPPGPNTKPRGLFNK